MRQVECSAPRQYSARQAEIVSVADNLAPHSPQSRASERQTCAIVSARSGCCTVQVQWRPPQRAAERVERAQHMLTLSAVQRLAHSLLRARAGVP